MISLKAQSLIVNHSAHPLTIKRYYFVKPSTLNLQRY